MFRNLAVHVQCGFRRCRSKSLPNLKPTIFALSSGHGKCGVAVIRISGPNAGEALTQVCDLQDLPKPRYALLKNLKHPKSREFLDQGLVLWFPGPKSFTGEDCCEFQVHGGVAVVSAVLDAIGAVPNTRLAKPGEFTRRAFDNGKLDLTEVEGLADLLQAETEAQRKQALRQAHGFLSKIYNNWKEVLLRCVAHVEAHIDFEETETIELDILDRVTQNVRKLRDEIERHLTDGRKCQRLRNGVRTVIIGEPNVGKSSLLNVLCRRPAAIVTPIEGTTRDVLEVTLDIGGYPVVLMDTAGLRYDTKDVIEQEGVNRALQSFENADLVVLVVDSTKYVNWLHTTDNGNFHGFLKYAMSNVKLGHLMKAINRNGSSINNDLFNKECVIVFNKVDLIDARDHQLDNLEPDGVVLVSCKTETGIDSLSTILRGKLKLLCGDPSEHVSMNQARHKQHLQNCLQRLDAYLDGVSARFPDTVLLAEHLRIALRHLGKLTGSVTTEQLLDVIFRDFCIGK